MKIPKKYISFAWLCAGNLIVYSLIFALFYGGVAFYTSLRLADAFPTIDNVMEYENYLRADQYEEIPVNRFRDSSMIVFDDNDGSVIYASNETVLDQIFYDDLIFIGDYYDYMFFSVHKESDMNDKLNYVIDLEEYDFEDGYLHVVDRCVLDEDLNIIEGTMFPKVDKISLRQMRLLQGSLNDRMNIQKISYFNDLQQPRTMVFLSPAVNDIAYDKVLIENDRIWLMAIPFFVGAALLQIYFFTKIIRRSFEPLKTAVSEYRKSAVFEIDMAKIPSELHPTVNEFKIMVNETERSKVLRKQMDEDKRRLISNITHDLKTPLTVIKGFAEALWHHKVAKDKEEKYLQTIYSRSEMLNDLIDSLFEYNVLDHPEYKADRKEGDLGEYVKQFLAVKYSEIISHGFELEIDIPDQPLIFAFDEKMFSCLLENLIGNAIKHNSAGTKIFVSMRKGHKELKLLIGDNGKGIDDGIIQDLFHPFVTADEARISKSGTGLGLSIVKKIVDLHEGKIKVESHVGSDYSTLFTMSFPVK